MAVFRIEKTKDYTVMANFHLRDVSLSLKAKGLLSLMLSLPDSWDYTTKGLSRICKDGVDSICTTVKELEAAGYVQRRRVRNELGHLTEVEYTILERPVPPAKEETPKRENPVLDKPVLDSPVQDAPFLAFPEQASPVWGNPQQEEPEQENPAQLNTNPSKKEKLNTELSNTHSFFQGAEQKPESVPANLTDGKNERERIREQIDYSIMLERYGQEQLDELVEIMLEVQMNRSPTIRIGRDAEYATAYVQERLSRINAMHIERVCDGIRDNRTQVKNTKAYLLAALFNAVSTLDTYYTMQVNHDFSNPY